MSRRRLIGLLIAALAAISGALYLSAQRNLPRDTSGTPLLPSLAKELNTVTMLRVIKGSATPTVTIQKQGERWTVAERANYPADVPKLRRLLVALSDARIREEKTSNPASFSVIGVEDPSSPGASGAQVDVVAQDGKHAVIVGKAAAEGSFVRRVGENASFIVEPAISLEAEPRYWIDTQLVDLAAAKIQSIDFKPASGPGYSLRRTVAANAASANAAPASSSTAKPTTAGPTPALANDFTLEGVPSGRKAADPQSLSPSPSTFGSLTADDVAQAADIDFGMASVAKITLSDGNVVTFTGTAIGDKRWIEVTATQDPALTARTAGRAFEIAAYRYDGIFRPLEQLLVPKEPPAAKKTATDSKLPATNPPAIAPKRPASAPAPAPAPTPAP
jgi:hypothetical protein